MILCPIQTSCSCFRTPTFNLADARDSDVFLATIPSPRDPIFRHIIL